MRDKAGDGETAAGREQGGVTYRQGRRRRAEGKLTRGWTFAPVCGPSFPSTSEPFGRFSYTKVTLKPKGSRKLEVTEEIDGICVYVFGGTNLYRLDCMCS